MRLAAGEGQRVAASNFGYSDAQRFTVAADFIDHLRRHIVVMDVDRSTRCCSCHVAVFLIFMFEQRYSFNVEGLWKKVDGPDRAEFISELVERGKIARKGRRIA